MTDTSAAVNVIENRSSEDEKKIISRLLIQKILSSDASKYLRKESYDRLTKTLISERIDEDFSINFRTCENRESYYSSIADLSFRWVKGDHEINDLDGNVWISYRLVATSGISSCYSLDPKMLAERADCIWNLSDLVDQIQALVPNGLRVMSLNNEQRQERDARRRNEKICTVLSNVLGSGGKAYRRGLRVGGKGRNVPRDLFPELQSLKVEAGTYNFEIREGSKRSPRYKKYIAVFPHSESHSVMIKRRE